MFQELFFSFSWKIIEAVKAFKNIPVLCEKKKNNKKTYKNFFEMIF